MKSAARRKKEKFVGVLMYDGKFRRTCNEADASFFKASNTRGEKPEHPPFEQDREPPVLQ
jgi:hypothetical protein